MPQDISVKFLRCRRPVVDRLGAINIKTALLTAACGATWLWRRGWARKGQLVRYVSSELFSYSRCLTLWLRWSSDPQLRDRGLINAYPIHLRMCSSGLSFSVSQCVLNVLFFYEFFHCSAYAFDIRWDKIYLLMQLWIVEMIQCNKYNSYHWQAVTVTNTKITN